MAHLFSIITVCYNSEKTIARTLDSVLGQTETDYEYIIIDGASTDHTLDIVESYRDKFGDRLQVYSEPDNGIYDAMNKGIQKATGELIGLVNSDDYYEIDALANMKNAYIANRKQHGEYAIYYGMQRRLRDGEEIEIEFINHRILGESMICHPTCFVSQKTYQQLGVYDTSYRSAADLDFLLRMKEKNVTFVPVYHIISNFELGGMSASGYGAREAARVRYKHGVYSRLRRDYVILQTRLIDLVHYIKGKR